MSRYIKFDDAVKVMACEMYAEAQSQGYDADGIEDFMPEATAWLNDAPSIDIDRPQGEWIESFKSVEVKRGAYLGTKFVHDGWSCSECSEVVEKRYPNCPYCLARMKGADDE